VDGRDASPSLTVPTHTTPAPPSALGRGGFIGVGAAGATLVSALAARGATIAAIASRHPARARSLAASLVTSTTPATPASPPRITTPAGVVKNCDLVILAVPDDVITPLSRELAWRPGQAVAHLSGARGANALEAAAARGARVAALHPLMTFARTDPPPSGEEALARLRGCTWAIEADAATLAEALDALVAALDGQAIHLDASARVPYHIAAVLASNYVAALMGAAVAVWQDFDAPPDAALPALLPLLRATVANLGSVGLPAALSGPIARGDVSTIAAHLVWLDAHVADRPEHAPLRDAYFALARLAIPLAEAKGTLSTETAARLRTLLADFDA
jgi:predicted short-subunit dehydrogenase-like oxidoreductase (DUF2520 family)